jgi:hypothetical protein
VTTHILHTDVRQCRHTPWYTASYAASDKLQAKLVPCRMYNSLAEG